MARRDNRNELVWGERNQRKLYDAKVAVVGSGLLSQMVLAGLGGLGIGNVYFIDNSLVKRDERDFLCVPKDDKVGQKKVRHIEGTLKKINEGNEESEIFHGIHSKFVEAFVYPYRPQVIIDATNDPISKESALRYALNYNVPVISASADGSRSAVSMYFPQNKSKVKLFSEKPDLEALLMHEFEGKMQSGFTSGVAAGLVCEEIRKLKFKYSDDGRDDNLVKRAVYNAFSHNRKGLESNASAPSYYKGKNVLIVGAGGIGNFVALNLALQGIGKIDIIDNDTADVHNLNRQILLYDRIDQRKSEVLAERVKEIDPHIESRGIYSKVGVVDPGRDDAQLRKIYETERRIWEQKPENKREKIFPQFNEFVEKWFGKDGEGWVTEQQLKEQDYDMIFGCLDNKFARIWLNNFAVRYGVPYIDGGTGPQSGQLSVYVPGKTKCVDCQLDLYNLPPPRSCAEGPEGSVVMSNMIIGSAMVGEAIRAMYDIGDAPVAPFRYRANSEARFALTNRVRNKNHDC